MRRKPSAEMLFDNRDDKHDGTIIRKPGSKKLYVLFYYHGRRVEKTTGLDDTPANRKKAKTWLDRQMEKIETNRFVFTEAFPAAAEEEKTFFAKREGWEYAPEPKDILFEVYVKEWLKSIWTLQPEGTWKDDSRKIIEGWLLPYFKDMTFFQISSVEIQKFLATLKWRTGVRKGQPLSKIRMKNILIPLRAIWNDACDQHRWTLHNPFGNLRKHFPKTLVKRREGFRFEEWLDFFKHVDPWYQPIVELMILTGMINSEMAGLRRSDIQPDYIMVQHTIVRGKEHATPKTLYRIRKIPITQAIRKRLDILLARSTGDKLVTTKSGTIFRPAAFLKGVWTKAAIASGITDKVPYSMRHSFAAWSLTLRIDPNRLVRLMGHGTKKMIYEVYGDYIEGLEEDFWLILEYYGKDFAQPKMKQSAIMMEYQNGFNFPPSIPLQPFNYSQQNEVPSFH